MEEHREAKTLRLKHLYINASTYKSCVGRWGEYRRFKGDHSKEHLTKEQQRKI